MTKSKEKICLITGATSGIGLATARGMARGGFKTLLVGRSRLKCEGVCKVIRKKIPEADISYLVADLSSQNDIRRLADLFKAEFDRLDVLINNAGARFLKQLKTIDGYEMTFALNHLAYFLLTQLLITHLESTGSGRIINVSSGVHTAAEMDFDDLMNQKNYMGKVAYNRSKLANLLFTYELARKTSGKGVTVNAVAPGNVLTNFSRNNGFISWAKHMTAHILARNLISSERAAETILYLAASPEVEGTTGKYFFEKKPVPSSKASYDLESAGRLWEISEALTTKTDRVSETNGL